MITELERRLIDAFHEDAQRARLTNPDEPAGVLPWPRSGTEDRASGRRSLGTVAAAITLIVVAGLALIQRGGDGTPVQIAPSPSASIPPTTPPVTTPPPVTVPRGPTQLFTDIAPDAMVTLPPAPVDLKARVAVWSGTEMIVWGGEDSRDEGAAFDPSTGTWRVIAPAPIDYRNFPAVAWTGTEMILWGGSEPPRVYADGAAYNPATDTWRRLPDAPLGARSDGAVAVWTGEEVVILAALGGGAAAYNPATDEWRRLSADLPGDAVPSQAVWTGTTILATVLIRDTPQLARYDPSTDTWDVDDGAHYAALVAVPGADGVDTVVALPDDTGAQVALLDSEGSSIGTLSDVPVDRGKFGDRIDALGLWAGEEALFWIGGDSSLLFPPGPAEGWALNPATGTWRPLPGGDQIPRLGGALVAAGGIVLAWGEDDAVGTGLDSGIAYRAPTAADG